MNENRPRGVRIRAVAYPLMAALLWGVAFVFQRQSAGHIGAFTYNASRSFLAAVCLALYLALRKKSYPLPREKADWRRLLAGGAVCGAALFAATNLQQAGLAGTEAGKAAFITAAYTVLVPIFGAFLGRKISRTLWVSVVLVGFGLYFLCMKGSFSLNRYDLLELACAVMYAAYILCVDRFVQGVNPVAMSCVQFLVMSALSWISALLFETVTWEAIRANGISILYLGIFSSAVAYTLQMAAQKIANPVTTTLLLSQESTISVIAGAVALGEWLSGRELLGGALMLAAVLLAQLPDDFLNRRKKTDPA